ncbi:hypothetical protein [Streptomyces erythrochromogenes]|uniref:hypothetical protein n=1 Tax=Streptomyces erythrochromogenes TaxID=285574 RepID=UPI0036B1AA9C
MSGFLGLDVQYSGTVPALLEGGRPLPVGDGLRVRIPHAYGEGVGWGSAAARCFLASGRATADRLLEWRRDPWDAGFLTGLRDRVARYLGLPEGAGPAPGYRVVLCAGPGTPADAEEYVEEAGLGGALRVGPAEALLCRRLASPGQPLPTGALLAVVVGERWSVLAPFRVMRSDGGSVVLTRTGPDTVLAQGGGEWTELLAGRVLARCREDAPAADLLALADGVQECAARLAQADAVEWQGAYAERLFAPLVVRGAELAADPAVADGLRLLGQSARAAVPGPSSVVLGGPGAVWPAIRSVLADPAAGGSVWCGPDPATDLAAGAAWWPLLRSCFAPVPSAGYAVDAVGAVPAVPAQPDRDPDAESSAPSSPSSPSTGRSGSGSGPFSPGSRRSDPLEVLPPWMRP